LSFRKEKKFRLTLSDQQKMKSSLFSSGMSKLFPNRTINSVYFDTNRLDMFFDSEEGILPRKKVRVRWYDEVNSLKKETKFSSLEGRYKVSEPYVSDNFLKNLNDNLLDCDYGLLKPILIVSYSREYFLLKNLRITFDSCIRYTDLNSFSDRSFSDEENVMEIKTSVYTDDDYIETIINHPTSRFSKYSRGLLKMNGNL